MPIPTTDDETNVLAYHAAQAAIEVLIEAGCTVETDDTAKIQELCQRIAERSPEHDSITA